ncbi:hypothetical protein BKA83DRAFT_669940 [Pisolithus microcarpus]|nr:hypothetical protein BKA83DRAFT_669940 [Pisolithus microcarpus]
MSIREPAWKKRTRPCPFYSQGRCLFADSCNFLHDIKVRAPVVDLSLFPQSIVVNAAAGLPSEGPPGPDPHSSRYSSLLSAASGCHCGDAMDAMFSECPHRLSSHSVTTSSNNTMRTVECFVCEADPVPPCEDNGVSRVVEDGRKEFEHEPTATPFGRQSFISVVSPFSGVSLLASPQDTCSKTFTCSHAQVHTPDLLSPVQMSAELRPFSLSSARCPPRRGDSIDSGYAEGDSWIDPEPLSRISPTKSIAVSSSSRSLQSTSPLMQECELAVFGRSSSSLGSIEASVPEGTEDCDDGTSSIIEIYSSSSDVEGSSSPTMKISDFITQHEARAGGMSAPLNTDLSSTAITSISPDSEQLKSLSDNNNASSGAALSAQPSLDFSDASSRVSLLRHDSPLSSRSGSSTPNTSLFSQDSDSSPVEECLSFPNLANVDHPAHSQEFRHDAVHRPVLAPFRNVASIEQESHSPQLGSTGRQDDDVNADADFPPCFPTPTRREDAEGRKFPLETIALIRSEGVLQFPMPPTSEDAALPAFFGGDSNACPSNQWLSTPSEDLYGSPPEAGLPDTNRTAHTLLRFLESLRRLWQAGWVKLQQGKCSSPSSLHLLDQQDMDDDPRDNYCKSPAFIPLPRDADISSDHESQHIALRSPWGPPCSPSLPAASLTSILSRSGSVFRPLLTGRKSLLEISLFGDRISQNTIPRDRAKEAGGASVSLNSLPFPANRPTPIIDDECSARPVNMSAVLESSSSHPRSHSAPPCRGLQATQAGECVLTGVHQTCINRSYITQSSNHTMRKFSSATSSSSIASVQSPKPDTPHESTVRSPSVLSSTISLGHDSLLSSPCYSLTEHNRITLAPSSAHSPTSPVVTSLQLSSQISPSQSSPRSTRAPTQPSSWRLSNYRASSRSYTASDHWPSRRNSTLSFSYAPSEGMESDGSPSSGLDRAIHVDHIPRRASASESPIHAIATPKPTLLFAIASDDVEQVRTVLESGEAGPNDPVGPQSALAFTLTNDRLARKNDIVKVLLAYGADPSALRNPALNPTARAEGNMCPPLETTLEGMDPATRYFVARADNAHTRQTSRLIYRSFFRPLTRVRYDVIGQDWALEQLFRVLSMHSQRLAVAPIVVLLCGQSNLMAVSLVGSLLEVPTHTVNMTTLRSTHDIWQSHSMSPYEEPSSYTLAEFLLANEGKRCVVVLDVRNINYSRRCSLGAGARHVDVHNVIWLGTSNIGHELVFEHHQNRPEQDEPLTARGSLRPRVSEYLGASLLSRVTTVLPFVPFTLEEKKAIAAESQEVEALVMRVLPHYVPGEGARSLHRAISNQLVNAL